MYPLSAKITFRRSALPEQLLEHRWGRLGVVLIGRMHQNRQKQPLRKDDHVALSTSYLLVRVLASARTTLPLGTGQLGIDDRRTGTWVAPGGYADGPPNPVAEPPGGGSSPSIFENGSTQFARVETHQGAFATGIRFSPSKTRR